jgi:hypothetical protein
VWIYQPQLVVQITTTLTIRFPLAAWEAVEVDLFGAEAGEGSFAMAAARGSDALLSTADDASGSLEDLLSQAAW